MICKPMTCKRCLAQVDNITGMEHRWVEITVSSPISECENRWVFCDDCIDWLRSILNAQDR